MKISGYVSKLDILVFQGDCDLVNYDQNTGYLREDTRAHASSHLKHLALYPVTLVCTVNSEISENMGNRYKAKRYT